MEGQRASPRRLHVLLCSQPLADSLPRTQGSEERVVAVSTPAAAAGVRWVRLHASQDGRRSEAFAVYLVDVDVIEACLGRLRRKLSHAEVLAIGEGERASAALAHAARRLAGMLLERLPRLPGPPPVRTLVVLVGLQRIQRHNGRGTTDGGAGAMDTPFVPYVMPLVHTCMGALLLEQPVMRVFLAPTEAKALEFVHIVSQVCGDEALLSQVGSQVA